MDFSLAFYRLLSRPIFVPFHCTKQEQNSSCYQSSHNVLIVFSKRLIDPYWSTSVSWVGESEMCLYFRKGARIFFSFNDSILCFKTVLTNTSVQLIHQPILAVSWYIWLAAKILPLRLISQSTESVLLCLSIQDKISFWCLENDIQGVAHDREHHDPHKELIHHSRGESPFLTKDIRFVLLMISLT